MSQEGFQEAMSGFYSAVASEDHKGACFMAVCRGKVSEGLDFCDGNGRAVIITGLPYPPSRDPRVMEKQKYLEDNRKNPQFKGLSGQQWYRLEATRAVNQVCKIKINPNEMYFKVACCVSQAIGRVIRHQKDYGAILLCDQRFSGKDIIQQLSAWVRPRVLNFPKIGPLLRDLGMFFRNADKAFPGSTKAIRAPTAIDPHREDVKKTRSTVDSFHHALSSGPSRVTSQHPLKANTASADIHHFDLSSYSSTVKPNLGKEISIFDGSQPSNNFIDFNETASPSLSIVPDRKPMCQSACQPAIKKRKLTILSNAEKAEYDHLRRMKVETAEQSSSCQSSGTAMENKKEKAAQYLTSAKRLLDPTRYTTFSDMIRGYQKDKNYELLIPTLRKLFLHDHKLRHLFKG
jgi:regulator of telomere elongation helicase 1